MEKNSFIFYRTYYDAIQKLPKAKRLGFFDALCKYALDDETPDFKDPTLDIMFGLMKGNLDSCDKRYLTSVENGKKGGAPKGNQNARKQPKKSTQNNLNQPKNNLNYNKNVDDNDNGSSTFVDDKTSPPSGSQPTSNPSEMDFNELCSEALRKIEESGRREEEQKAKERERLYAESAERREHEQAVRKAKMDMLTQGGEVSAG